MLAEVYPSDVFVRNAESTEPGCRILFHVEAALDRYYDIRSGCKGPPPSDAVREAAEVVRTILTAHDARLSESGVLTYGPPSKGTGFVAAIQWLRRYDAARGGE